MKSDDRWCFLGLLGLVLWIFREPVFLGAALYQRDIHLVWYSQVESFVRAIAAGSWPGWDPFPAGGQPLLADPSAQIVYPFTWLNLVLRPWTYYTLFACVHVLFPGIGSTGSAAAGGCLEPAASWPRGSGSSPVRSSPSWTSGIT